MVLAVDGQTGGNYTAVFTVLDRGILTNGYHILVEAMDRQGNINSVEKSGALEKNWWEKLADKVASWLNVLGAVARAFLAWLVEAFGAVVGFVLGLMTSIAKNIVDMIFGIPSMIDMVVNHIGEMVDAFGKMLGNIGQVFAAMIDGFIQDAEQVLPNSWRSQAPVTAATVLDNLVKYLQNPWGFSATARLYYDLAYTAGSILGSIFINFLGGGAMIFAKIKTMTGIASLMTGATGALGMARKGGKLVEDLSKGAEIVAKDTENTLGAARQIERIGGDLEKLDLFTSKELHRLPTWRMFSKSPWYDEAAGYVKKATGRISNWDQETAKLISQVNGKFGSAERAEDMAVQLEVTAKYMDIGEFKAAGALHTEGEILLAGGTPFGSHVDFLATDSARDAGGILEARAGLAIKNIPLGPETEGLHAEQFLNTQMSKMGNHVPN